MNKIDVTVVVPTFSDSRYYVSKLPMMRRLWISLKSQTDKAFSLVAVDNGSFDDTESLFRDYFADEVFVRYNNPNHRGGARNLGARLATTPNLIFLDCDLIVYPTFIENYRTFAQRHPAAIGLGIYVSYWNIVHRGLEFIVGEGDHQRIDYSLLEETFDFSKTMFLTRLPRKFSEHNKAIYDCSHYSGHKLFSGNFGLPRSLFFSLGGFDDDFHGYGHEDTMLGYVAQHRGVPRYILSNVCCIHQCHRDGPQDRSHLEDRASEKANYSLMESKLALLRGQAFEQ